MVGDEMAKEAKSEQKLDDPSSAILALVEEALALADQHGFARAGIYLDQARSDLRGDAGQPRL